MDLLVEKNKKLREENYISVEPVPGISGIHPSQMKKRLSHSRGTILRRGRETASEANLSLS